ncbi:hypothetical protein BDQ12DRAFT_699705 [Crucibulum laeve]|uniref:CxC6 like cysteine cluster associated with KDZ domain-containing protein n=1 Tax=Crucibulum laeve TaxID=68775 RepID=A0A5C3LTD3_9AGAR|nr:hypothetical protein BDQ12DRAFT_699705 [Crucibulum laeve]
MTSGLLSGSVSHSISGFISSSVSIPGSGSGSGSGFTAKSSHKKKADYRKYCAAIAAKYKLDELCKANAWNMKKPSNKEVIELVIGKSMWHSYYKPAFHKISEYPDMKEWLEGEENPPDDIDVWGFQKTGKPSKVKGKGKKRGKEAERGKEKEKKDKSKKGLTSKRKLNNINLAFWWLIVFAMLPAVHAASTMDDFPDISFKVFSDCIKLNFSSKISLATVLLILFTMTENNELLSLYAWQANPLYDGENDSSLSGWMRCLSRALVEKLNKHNSSMKLFHKREMAHTFKEEKKIVTIGNKLDSLAKVLKLYPCDKIGYYKGNLPTISYKSSIQAIMMICPSSGPLYQITHPKDIPMVTLIKGNTIYENAWVLTGQCSDCKVLYSADHERIPSDDHGKNNRVYLNIAKYLKIGHNLWCDQSFSNGVVTAMYSFHASAAAYTEYWNNTFGIINEEQIKIITCQQIWQAFSHLTLNDGLSIDEVTSQAVYSLVQNGIISSAHGHSCTECTQKYKSAPDIITTSTPEMDDDNATVSMVVVDGIVMAPKHCAFENCTDDLANACGGVFCAFHENQYGSECCWHTCENQKLSQTQSCLQHQPQWKKYVQSHSCANLLVGEQMSWQISTSQNAQAHDEEIPHDRPKDHYFGPSKFYCVETICAPCGVVIAWDLFDRSDSATQILDFLERIFPKEESRPTYICIDKACLLLQSAISNQSWEKWKKTTRFIACEQLNGWLGDFESILKRMTPNNFKWFLHTMLFYHTRYVINKQNHKIKKGNTIESESEEED